MRTTRHRFAPWCAVEDPSRWHSRSRSRPPEPMVHLVVAVDSAGGISGGVVDLTTDCRHGRQSELPGKPVQEQADAPCAGPSLETQRGVRGTFQ